MEIPRKPLRLWPGVVIAILLGLLRFVLPAVVPDMLMYSVLGGLVGGLLVPVWWLFLSRAPWSERWGAIALMLVALFATKLIIHESIAGGAMGFLFPFLAIPVLGLAFVGWAVATRRLPDGLRRATMAAPDRTRSRSRGGRWGFCSLSWRSRSWASPSSAGRWPPAGSPTDFGARRWPPAARGR